MNSFKVVHVVNILGYTAREIQNNSGSEYSLLLDTGQLWTKIENSNLQCDLYRSLQKYIEVYGVYVSMIKKQETQESIRKKKKQMFQISWKVWQTVCFNWKSSCFQLHFGTVFWNLEKHTFTNLPYWSFLFIDRFSSRWTKFLQIDKSSTDMIIV